MSIEAAVISRAVFDKPIQPLFNTIYTSSLNAGIPVIITNTNTNLRVTVTATIGSVAAGTAITDAMFANNKSGIKVDGFSMTDNTYFTVLDIESNISQLPNEMRTEAAGMDSTVLAEVLITIGVKICEQLIKNYFTNLQANIVALVPESNVETGMAGKIEWNPIVEPAAGKTSITQVLEDVTRAFPDTMKQGGAAGSIVVAWISADDFMTMRNGTIEAYQHNKNGGLTSNFYQYVKQESSITESRDMINREFIRYNNVIITPLPGLANDSLITTYQQGIEDARVFYDKVPAGQMNNLYMVIKGAFIRNDNLTVPVAEKSQQLFFNLPYQVGSLLAINKVENAIAKYKVLTDLSSGILFRESDKVFAKLPN